MLAVLGYRTAARAADVLPAPLADAVAAGIGRIAFAARVPARGALEANLARLVPDSSPAWRRARAREAFVGFAVAFSAFLRRRRAPVPGAIEVRGRDHLEAARASGRGVILLSAHLGDWEGGAAALAALGLPVRLAARGHGPGAVERIFARRREAAGVAVLPPSARLSGFTGALRRHEWVALMADRGAGRRGGASVCGWAAAVAERTGAMVLPVVCVRSPSGRLTLCVESPLSPECCRTGAFRDTMRTWLERWPGQWAGFEPLPAGLA
jgi:KDO2-lipid IV(A) lauroyltransferase